MAYALSLSDEELSIVIASMNGIDPAPFPKTDRITFYRLLAQFTRAYAKKSPNGFQLMVQLGGAKPLEVLEARLRLTQVEGEWASPQAQPEKR
jgi:hypothetical protein